MEPYNFQDVPAKVFSFSHDYVVETTDSPVTVTFVDFEGGGRLMCDMTDRDPAAVEVGMPLEMTFRRLYYVGGIHNYWWKCQPVRCQVRWTASKTESPSSAWAASSSARTGARAWKT